MKLTCYLLRESARPSLLLRPTEADVRYYGRVDEAWVPIAELSEVEQTGSPLAVTYRTSQEEASPWQATVGTWEQTADQQATDFALENRPDRGAMFMFRCGRPARWIVWTLGRAHRYLIRSLLEPRFGVITVLNSLTADNREAALRKLQVRREGGVPQLVGRVAFGDAPVNAFDLDEVWDAIKAVGGNSPTGRIIYGSVGLTEAHPIDHPDELETLSVSNLQRFRKQDYKRQFDFLDNYVPVTDAALISELDAQLVAEIGDDTATAAFTLPSVVGSFGGRDVAVRVCFPGERSNQGRVHLTTTTLTASSRLQGSDGRLDLTANLRFVDQDDLSIHAPVRDCLVSEFEHGGATYALADGTYHEVDRAFLANLDAFLEARISPLPDAPTYHPGMIEDAWLDSAADTGRFLKLHPEAFSVPDGIGTVEIADLVSKQGVLLHVKRRADTASAAEVSRQAASASEALLRYVATEDWLSERQPSPPFEGLSRVLDLHPRPPIGIVLLGRSSGDLPRLSLLAKLAVRRMLRHLDGQSFSASLHFVPTEEM